MDKHIVIAPIGDNSEAIFIGLRDFPTEKLILLSPKNKVKIAEKIKKDVEKFYIKVNLVELEGPLWESLFEEVAKIKSIEGEKNLIINTSAGDRSSQCALTSAAFVNGVKAFAVEGNETMLLPILKFSYYKTLTDKKMKILKILYNEKECCNSLEELSKKVKMSLPLISYHVNGTPKSEGLKKLGLIEVNEEKGRTSVRLSTMGNLLVKGYVT